MDYSVIFEKKYSQFIQECCRDIPENPSGNPESANTTKGSLASIGHFLENTVCVLIPERIEKRSFFINLAKKIGAAYLIDIVIKEFNDRITVMYTLDCDASFHCLKPIIQLADEFSFRSEQDTIVMTLDYYTHATYCSGHRILPLSD